MDRVDPNDSESPKTGRSEPMVLLSVQHGKVDRPQTRQTARSNADKPMRWAVRKLNREAVHVSQLTRAEKGLGCKCVCPACESPLQAVNAGVDREHFLRENARGQFFRHQAGQQRDNCLLVIARLAALQLLLEQQEIDLPAPRCKRTVQGISGELYQAEVAGKSTRFRVRERCWVDSQTATITDDSGRIVLLRLDSQRTVTEQGSFDGIITITVDDPDIASWDKEKILAQMQLNDGQSMACWDKHWSDKELGTEAQLAAEEQAAKYLDLLPSNIGNLDGFTQAQKSESILHHAIKSILTKATKIISPVFHDLVRQKMPDGTMRSAEISFSLGELKISQNQAERAIANMVADVHCKAAAIKERPFDLIIEVAVTHHVDQGKLEKIRALNLACLEIDVQDFKNHGRITLDTLANEVLSNVKNKRWLHHPLIAERRTSASRALAHQAAQMAREAKDKYEAQMWLASLDQAGLLEEYKRQLMQHWRLGKTTSMPAHLDLSNRLTETGLIGTDQEWMSEVIRFLHLSKSHAHVYLPSSESLWDICTELHKTHEGKSAITYCLMGLKVFGPNSSSKISLHLKNLREAIMSSLKAGEFTYARSGKFDPLIHSLFPELAANLKLELGTQAYAMKIQNTIRAARVEKLKKEAEERVALDATQRIEELRQEIHAAIRSACANGWMPKLGLASSVEHILQHEEIRLEAKEWRAHSVNISEVVSSAWKFREDKKPLQQWFAQRKFTHPDEVRAIQRILKKAWLIR